MNTPGFEGSFMGAEAKISDLAIMECKICWTPYDPAEGDDFRQVLPGTPFTALPEDWTCPNCSAPKEQFLVLEDPGSETAADGAKIEAATAALVADFTEVYHAKMRDVPIINKALHVEAIGFRAYEGNYLGVLISPWFMNLVVLPGADDWSDLKAGAKEEIEFPSGVYEFLHNTREISGGYKACSLFSPMSDFASQMQAQDVARAVMVALFQADHREDTDRAADIRAAREAELAPPPEAEQAPEVPILTDVPTRRKVITGGMASDEA